MLRPYTWGTSPMFIGHYALALAAKRAAPRASLGTLFAATSLADLLWPVFLLLGWERAHVVQGPNPFLALWLDSIPISHSLVTLIGWGALFGFTYRTLAGIARWRSLVTLLGGGAMFTPPRPTPVGDGRGGV